MKIINNYDTALDNFRNLENVYISQISMQFELL